MAIEDLRTAIARIDAQLGALAAPAPDFVGRTDAIERLAQALLAGNGHAALSGVRGLGGIGKNQLAYTVAPLPDDLGQLQAIFASALAGKRVLILAERVRKKLDEWRAAAAKPARKPRKRRGG
jgi:hypothetical protein